LYVFYLMAPARWLWSTFQGQTRRRHVPPWKTIPQWDSGLGGGLRSLNALYYTMSQIRTSALAERPRDCSLSAVSFNSIIPWAHYCLRQCRVYAIRSVYLSFCLSVSLGAASHKKLCTDLLIAWL